MPETVIVDCEAGTIERREYNADELAQHVNDKAEHAKLQQQRQQDEATREGVLTALAQKLGVPTDDLKQSLGVGRRETPVNPRKKKLMDERRAARQRELEAEDS